MDLIEFALSFALLVCCVILFVCVIAFAILVWKLPRSKHSRGVNSPQRRALFFFLVESICAWILSLIQALLAFKLIPKSGVFPVQIIGAVFIFIMFLLMVSMFIQIVKDRKALGRTHKHVL